MLTIDVAKAILPFTCSTEYKYAPGTNMRIKEIAQRTGVLVVDVLGDIKTRHNVKFPVKTE